ncbi:cytochrome P450 4C1-like [Pseudomyrmex gracilis]|uniref:cytochrome P450 4C1-like n=1 Tax=Pseudomyrmex gracilis TaxID=219809 RepID=UPI000995997F|nr:cytochrome P450 4C1-like [Pseudomyrmex gracilis]
MYLIFLMLSTLSIGIIFIIISAMYNQYTIRQKLKRFPQISGFPFIGVIFKLINKPDYERMKWILSQINEYKEGIFVQWIGPSPIIHIFKPEFLEIIFPSTTNIKKGSIYHLLRSWLGNGLLTSSGLQWFHDRKLIGPTFHFSILEQFVETFHEKSKILTKCLEKEIEKNPTKPINIFPFSINVTLDIICETAMGVNVHAQEDNTKYTSTVHKVSKMIINRFLRPWYMLDSLYYLTPTGKEYKATLNDLHEFTRSIIKKRKIERQLKNDYDNLENIDDVKRKKAFLDLLLDENEKSDTPLTDDEVRAQVDTFMFEGHDTTAVAITWTLFCLGNSPKHQEKVHEELEEVFKDLDAPVTIKDLSQLKYLDRVIKETLRIYPSVPMIGRELTEDVNLGDYVIPKGMTIILAIVLAHRNPEVWPDPLKFDPDRFLPENSKNRNPYAYVPFSAGPRNCIGQRFALLEEKVVLSSILRKWRVKSVKTHETIRNGGSLIYRPAEDVLIHFTPKN